MLAGRQNTGTSDGIVQVLLGSKAEAESTPHTTPGKTSSFAVGWIRQATAVATHPDEVPISSDSVGMFLLTCAPMHGQQAAPGRLNHAGVVQRMLQLGVDADLDQGAGQHVSLLGMHGRGLCHGVCGGGGGELLRGN